MEKGRRWVVFAVCVLIITVAFNSACKQNAISTHRTIVDVKQVQPLELPKGKRVAFGWNAIGMMPGDTISVQLKEKLKKAHNWFRLTVAQEIWDEKLIHVLVPVINTEVGSF